MFQRFSFTHLKIIIICLGILLLGTHLWVASLNQRFAHHLAGVDKPVLWLVAGLLVSGALYLGIIAIILKRELTKPLLIGLLILGGVMRLSYFSSVPMLEDDHYRYLWEGATLAEGVNPYTYSINEIWQGKHLEHAKADALTHLSMEGAAIMQGANYKTLRSVYPMTAQLAFAAGYIISPFSLDAFRVVLMISELAVVALLIFLLKALQRPVEWALIYWLNPLAIKEIINSAHVDVVATPFILLAIYGVLKHRQYIAGLCLGVAAGVKLWPFMLFAPLWRRTQFTLKNLIGLFLLSLVCLGGYALCVYAGWQDHGSAWQDYAKELGFVAYAKKWEMNDGIYMGFMWLANWVSDDFYIKHRIARWIMAAILLATIAWRIWGRHSQEVTNDDKGTLFIQDAFWIVYVLFLISPTQFPWYFTWVLPFVCFVPRWSALSLSVLLGIYYARFYFQHHGDVVTFDHGWVWAQYVPVLLLLLLEVVGKLPTWRSIPKKHCAQID